MTTRVAADKPTLLMWQTGHQAAEMARAAGAVDVARMSVVVHANLESEEQVRLLLLLVRFHKSTVLMCL